MPSFIDQKLEGRWPNLRQRPLSFEAKF